MGFGGLGLEGREGWGPSGFGVLRWGIPGGVWGVGMGAGWHFSGVWGVGITGGGRGEKDCPSEERGFWGPSGVWGVGMRGVLLGFGVLG